MSYFGLNYVTFLVLLLCNMEIYGNYHFYTFFILLMLLSHVHRK